MTENEDSVGEPPPEAAPRFRVDITGFRLRFHRAGRRMHKAEHLSHLAYFGMLITSLEYKLAACFCLLFGVATMFIGSDEEEV